MILRKHPVSPLPCALGRGTVESVSCWAAFSSKQQMWMHYESCSFWGEKRQIFFQSELDLKKPKPLKLSGLKLNSFCNSASMYFDLGLVFRAFVHVFMKYVYCKFVYWSFQSICNVISVLKIFGHPWKKRLSCKKSCNSTIALNVSFKNYK